MTIWDIITDFSRYVHRITDVDISQMAGLSKGTGACTLKTTNQIVYGIYNTHNLIFPATDNIAMTACAQQAASTFCYYLGSINIAGTITVTKGIDNTYALPPIPPGTVAMGAMLINTDGSHTFTSGTTDTAAAGITAAFFDIDTGIALNLINKAQARLERGVTIVYNKRQRTIQDFTYMKSRAQVTINANDSTVVLPFPGYKDFVDETLQITDSAGLTTQLTKDDTMPTGIVFQSRPQMIGRYPAVETVFMPDGAPAMTFNIWPQADQSYTLDATCYQYSPTLDGVIYSETWLTDNAPDILLFGALVESASYFPNDTRIDEWRMRYNEAVFTMWTAQNKESYSGDFIRTKFPNPMGRQSGNIADKSYVMSFGEQG